MVHRYFRAISRSGWLDSHSLHFALEAGQGQRILEVPGSDSPGHEVHYFSANSAFPVKNTRAESE